MPTSSDSQFSFEVLVGSEPLREYKCPDDGAPSADSYVVVDFHTPMSYFQTSIERDPYGEKFENKWPVTPYILRARNNSPHDAFARVYIDGNMASSNYVQSGKMQIITGYQSQVGNPRSEITEFLFCMPRVTDDHDDLNTTEYGTIAVRFHRCGQLNETILSPPPKASDTAMVVKRCSKEAGISAVCGYGKTLQTAINKSYTTKCRNALDEIGSLRIRYGMANKLQMTSIDTKNRPNVVKYDENNDNESDPEIEVVQLTKKRRLDVGPEPVKSEPVAKERESSYEEIEDRNC